MSPYQETLIPLADDNEGVRQTLQRMQSLIMSIEPNRRRPSGVSDMIIEDVFYWVRGHLHYQEHPPGEQTLITPAALLDMIDRAPDGRAVGDCVSYTVLLGYLLDRFGVSMSLVVRSKRADRVYDHVYLRVLTSQGWTAADASGDAAFGWEDHDVTAREEVRV